MEIAIGVMTWNSSGRGCLKFERRFLLMCAYFLTGDHRGAPITRVDVHHRPNEVLIKILSRNISSIPTYDTPEHTTMKRQIILSIAFSVLAANAFAASSVHPVIAEGGSDRLIENRVAEGGSDRLTQNHA